MVPDTNPTQRKCILQDAYSKHRRISGQISPSSQSPASEWHHSYRFMLKANYFVTQRKPYISLTISAVLVVIMYLVMTVVSSYQSMLFICSIFFHHENQLRLLRPTPAFPSNIFNPSPSFSRASGNNPGPSLQPPICSPAEFKMKYKRSVCIE